MKTNARIGNGFDFSTKMPFSYVQAKENKNSARSNENHVSLSLTNTWHTHGIHTDFDTHIASECSWFFFFFSTFSMVESACAAVAAARFEKIHSNTVVRMSFVMTVLRFFSSSFASLFRYLPSVWCALSIFKHKCMFFLV